MENLKPLSKLLEPDRRTKMFVSFETSRHLSLEEHYAEVVAISLNPNAPEEVRSYFATIQNLHAYSWFSYDFYPIVEFLGYTVVEMALRLRFPVRGKDNRGLQALIKKAIKGKVINQKKFSHVQRRRKMIADGLREDKQWARARGRKLRYQKYDFLGVMEENLPGIRNSYAHPNYHTIIVPGHARNSLRFAAEFINQLFPATDGC